MLSIEKNQIHLEAKVLKCIVQLLRNYGRLISGIDCNLFSQFIEEQPFVIDYLNSYCHEILDCIFLDLMCIIDIFQYFKKPFINVKSVGLNLVRAMQKFSLVRLFPKMEFAII